MKLVDLKMLNYDGSQLHHAFAYEKVRILGETVSIFRGRAHVKKHLVDLEDSLADDLISANDMWHFIIEIPGATIMESVAIQRLFICKCIEVLQNILPGKLFIRRGDDIIVRGKKLSVSIATLSRFGGLIHVGINIDPGSGCPVPATGLIELLSRKKKVDREFWIKNFGRNVAHVFIEEYEDMKEATYKVKEVE
jgi:hypothetical protein